MIEMYGGAAASRGFLLLEEVLRSVSPAGLWSMGILFGIVLVLAFTSPGWWPALNGSIARSPERAEAGGRFSTWTSPYGGAVAVLSLYFLLFPLWSLLASDPNAWWVFLIFGWGAAGIVVYVWHCYRRIVSDRH